MMMEDPSPATPKKPHGWGSRFAPDTGACTCAPALLPCLLAHAFLARAEEMRKHLKYVDGVRLKRYRDRGNCCRSPTPEYTNRVWLWGAVGKQGHHGEDLWDLETYHSYRRPVWEPEEEEALRNIMASAGADFTWDGVAEMLYARTKRPSLRHFEEKIVYEERSWRSRKVDGFSLAGRAVYSHWRAMRKKGEPESAAEIAKRELVEERWRAQEKLLLELERAPTSSSIVVAKVSPVPKVVLTEADVPPMPPPLGKNASDAEKASRAAHMDERRRVKEQLRHQRRSST